MRHDNDGAGIRQRIQRRQHNAAFEAHSLSALKGRDSKAAIASSIETRSLMMSSTAAQIGISTLYFAASATTAGALSMPSATERRSARMSFSLRPSPRAAPSAVLRAASDA